MNHLDELIDLTQQLVSVLDDMGPGIISTDIQASSGKVSHFCNPNFFLEHFSTFDIIKRPRSNDFPVEIKTEVEGVMFMSILHEGELSLIGSHLPDDWFRPIEIPAEIIHVNFEQIKNPSALACE